MGSWKRDALPKARTFHTVIRENQVTETKTTPETATPTPTLSFGAAPTGNLPAARNKPKVTLSEEEQAVVGQNLASLSIRSISLPDLATFASEPEENLGNVLSGFLSRIDMFDNPQIFKLVDELGEQVEGQKLDKLADRIMNAKPTRIQQFQMLFMSKKARRALLDQIFGAIQDVARNSTTTLQTVVDNLDKKLQIEQAKLMGEIGVMTELKDRYKISFREFAMSVAIADAFLEKARSEVNDYEKSMDSNDPAQRTELAELKAKLQALESRALALEGTYTRLPADQLVIGQLEGAAISTLQETTTTAAQRSNSIKMTLVTLNTAMVARSTQRVAEEGKAIDQNLAAVRGKVTAQVVDYAANAPGNNRLDQANQIKKIVAETEALVGIVDAARTANKQKFATARTTLEQARKDMLRIALKS
jgi:hypothetical protein